MVGREEFRFYVIPVLLLALVILFLVAYSHLVPGKDATDPPDGRSGMSLLTDHETGCQYLYRSGAITPRMDGNGKQICSKH